MQCKQANNNNVYIYLYIYIIGCRMIRMDVFKKKQKQIEHEINNFVM